MIDYNQFKVVELKKLLSERGLPLDGRKEALVTRLAEHDKTLASKTALGADKKSFDEPEDEIDYDDGDIAKPAILEKSTSSASAAPQKPTASTQPMPSSESSAALTNDAANEVKPGEIQSAVIANANVVTKSDNTAQRPTPNSTDNLDSRGDSKDVLAAESSDSSPSTLSAGLKPSEAETEAAKRAARARRFATGVRDDDSKKAERTLRFGLDQMQLERSLDSALPERIIKRRLDSRDTDVSDSQTKRRDRGFSRNRRADSHVRSGRAIIRRGNHSKPAGGKPFNSGRTGKTLVLDDPAERAKAQSRAKRFAA